MNRDQKQAQGQLLMLKGIISDMSAEQQANIKEARAKIDAVIAEYPDGEALMAMGMVGLEQQLEN